MIEMSVVKLELSKKPHYVCPKCGGELNYVEGQALHIDNGHVDMGVVLPRHECPHCGVYYQELLGSGYFDEFPLETADKRQEKPTAEAAPSAGSQTAEPASGRHIKSTGELQPMKLKADANGQCVCPRCGELMHLVDGEAVKIVDGRPDFENVKAHFVCDYCHSVFRRIAETDFFQWSEK